jgi:hypothetical protein
MVLAAFLVATSVNAQSLLNKKVTLNVSKQKLITVLKSIEQQCDFYFSYPGHTIKTDSLVSISVQNKTVRQTLDILFDGSMEYDETEKHVIIRKAVQQVWYASGYVYDGITGEKMSNVSVYERRQLVSTMTNEQGYYRLKLKDKSQPAQISISKAYYIDTVITVKPSPEQELTVSIVPRENILDTIEITNGVEKSWLGKLFVSSGQRIASINMSEFFVNMPVQTSFTPGLGTHGKMSSQVVNKFSLNIVGGLTGGTNGVEIGCMFNINKKDAKYVQIAGIFNLVGGNVYGTQVGGIYNQVQDSLEGIQITGFGNVVNGAVDGAQVAGFGNYAKNHVKGSQISGFANVNLGTTSGIQIGGFGNFSKEKMDGVQISAAANIAEEMNGTQIGGLFNYAKKLDGLQIGIFNYADTSSGYSLGFLSFVRKGYHKLSISTNEVFNVNAAFKTGNTKYYSILFLGANLGKQEAYSYGYGIGTEIKLVKNLALSPELSAHFLYLGGWDVNIMPRGTLNLQYKVANWFTIYAGPAYSYYYTDQKTFYTDFKNHPAPAGYNVTTHNASWSSWMGWNVGVNIF